MCLNQGPVPARVNYHSTFLQTAFHRSGAQPCSTQLIAFALPKSAEIYIRLGKKLRLHKAKGRCVEMNPQLIRSSLEMLIVNTFRNIMRKESDPLTGHVFIPCTVTYIHIIPFCPVGLFFNELAKKNHMIFSSVRRKCFVTALCWIVLSELVYGTVRERGHILSPQIEEIMCQGDRF